MAGLQSFGAGMSAIAGQLSELVGILVNALVLGVSVGVLAVLTDWRK